MADPAAALAVWYGAAHRWTIACPECDLYSPQLTHPGEADLLARIHNDLHHGGHPVAAVKQPAAVN